MPEHWIKTRAAYRVTQKPIRFVFFFSKQQQQTKTQRRTYLDSLVAQGKVVSDVFSFCLNPTQGGVLAVGEIAPYHVRGAIHYIPQVRTRKSGFYEVEVTDLRVGGQSLGFNPTVYNTKHCIVDTGTPVPTLPIKVFNAMANYFQALCKKGHALPGVCGVPLDQSIFAAKCFPMTTAQIASFPNISFALSRGVTLDYVPSQYLRPMYFCATNTARIDIPSNTTLVGLALQGDSSSFGM